MLVVGIGMQKGLGLGVWVMVGVGVGRWSIVEVFAHCAEKS